MHSVAPIAAAVILRLNQDGLKLLIDCPFVTSEPL